MAKKPFSRPEWHTVITSYGSLIISLIALVLSGVSMYQSYVSDKKELVQILSAKDDGFYYFDGEKLFKKFLITVVNNSTIPVSLVELEIGRGGIDGETRTFGTLELPDIFPYNLESNHAEIIEITWLIDLSDNNLQEIKEAVKQRDMTAAKSSQPTENNNFSDLLMWKYTADFSYYDTPTFFKFYTARTNKFSYDAYTVKSPMQVETEQVETEQVETEGKRVADQIVNNIWIDTTRMQMEELDRMKEEFDRMNKEGVSISWKP